MPSPSVIVTGAGGFIGSHVAAGLTTRGWRVGACGHRGRDCGEVVSRWGDLDGALLSELCHELGPPDAIIHCAGGASVARSLEDPAADFERTVTSTLRVLDFIRTQAPNARLVFLSSAAVYGATNIEPLSEDLSKQPMSPYGEHKAIAEDHVRNWAEQFGLSATTLRLFSVYGPGLRKQLLWELSRRALAGEDPLTLFGSGQERRDFIAIEDTVDLIVRAADPHARPPSVINGGTGEATTVRALAESLVSALGCSAEVRFNGVTKAGDPATLVADTRQARAFGFTPSITLEQGLANYAAWVRGA